MKNISGNSRSDLTASVRGISLTQARQMLGPSASTGNVAITGELNADAKASWGKTLNDLVAKADATITAQAKGAPPAAHASPAGATPAAIPVNSAIHATYTAANQQLALAQSYLQTPATNLTMNGVISKRSSLAVHLEANDLREVAAIAGLFTPAATAQPLDLSGAASFQGTVQGSISAPHIAGQLSASNLHVNGTDWKVVRTSVDASPSAASLQHADLEPQTGGRITFSASTGLDQVVIHQYQPHSG